MSSRSLIVMPDDTGQPLVEAIDGARVRGLAGVQS